MTALSILELARVTEGSDARAALDNARDLAAHAEGWGYRRLWVAEHHNMPGIASAATAVVLAHIAGGPSTLRVGAGGTIGRAPCRVRVCQSVEISVVAV